MKKLLSILLVFALMITLVTPSLYAYDDDDDDDDDDDSGLYIMEPVIAVLDPELGYMDEDAKYVYAYDTPESEVKGATYDKDSNTLTIEGLTTDKELLIYNPGTDFTVCVTGTNEIGGGINAYCMGGDGGEEVVGVTITGTGSLSIDTEEENAIRLGSYFGGSTLTIGKDVTLNLKSKKDVIGVYMVTEKGGSPTDRVLFADTSLSIDVASHTYSYTGTKRIEACYPSTSASGEDWLGKKGKKASDPTGIYTITQSWRWEDSTQDYTDEFYSIDKYIWCESIGYYIEDYIFREENNGELELTPAQFATSDFSYVLNGEEKVDLYNPTYLNSTSSADVYKHKETGKEYVVEEIFHWDDETNSSYYTKEVYDIVKEITEIPGKYYLTKNTTVSVEDLEEVEEETVYDGVFNYFVETPELTIVPTGTHEHDLVEYPAKQAECEEDGYLNHYRCKGCNAWFVDGEGKELIADHSTVILKKLGHDYQTLELTKATLTTDGSIHKKCSRCDSDVTETIFHPKTFVVSKVNFTYNGKVQKPTVTVKDSEGYTINKSNYDLVYSKGCKNVGAYTVTVKFKGKYSGSKSIGFKINPKGTSLGKLTPASKAFTANWTRQTTQTTGYEILSAKDSSFTKGKKTTIITSNKTKSKKITKLSGKKKYYVKIRTYKKVNGKKYYSGWSKVKTVTTKR